LTATWQLWSACAWRPRHTSAGSSKTSRSGFRSYFDRSARGAKSKLYVMR
jgi:hypothetical protein